jgi:choline dehydrogenase/4-pyridoxate dehydrogenase
LTVEVKAQVTRVAMDGCRAVGVDYIRNGERVTARARREIILSAGAINSPQLLMLSGMGPPEELAQHDIPVRVPLAGVGKNLQDHAAALIVYGRSAPGPVHRNRDWIASPFKWHAAICSGPASQRIFPAGLPPF